MSRKTNKSSSWFCEPEPDEPETERSIFARFFEWVVVFGIACFILKMGVSYLVSIKVPLIIISAVLVVGFIIYRICRHRRHYEDF